MLRSQAVNLVEPLGTWPGPAPKIPKTFSGTFSATFSGTRWTWLGFAPKLPKSFSGTFSGTLLNLIWLCTQSLPDLLRNLLRNPVEPTWLCTKASQNLLRNLLRNPVEPDLALHQSLPHLLGNLLRNPVEPDLALHQSLPDLHRNILRNPVEPDRFCTKASHTFSGTFSGSLLNATWPSPETFLEPAPEPCWTWLGFAPRLPGTFSGSPEPSWTWPVSAPKPPKPDLSLHQSLPNLLGNRRNLLGNLVEPDLVPAPVHTGAILGWIPG